MKLPHRLLITILILVAICAGFSLGRLLDISRNAPPASPPYPSPQELIGQRRPDFLLADLHTRPRSISEWDGQAVLLNFWATWCEPCRKEIPDLNTVHQEFSNAEFTVIGIALDLPDMVADFHRQYAIKYPILVGQVAADEVIRQYGNQSGGLPYSVFIDRSGVIRHIHSAGVLNETELRQLVTDLLEK